MPNMTMPRRTVIFGATHLKDAGSKSATPATMMTKTAMYLEIKSLTLTNICIEKSPSYHVSKKNVF
jgi:hypothetical protein